MNNKEKAKAHIREMIDLFSDNHSQLKSLIDMAIKMQEYELAAEIRQLHKALVDELALKAKEKEREDDDVKLSELLRRALDGKFTEEEKENVFGVIVIANKIENTLHTHHINIKNRAIAVGILEQAKHNLCNLSHNEKRN